MSKSKVEYISLKDIKNRNKFIYKTLNKYNIHNKPAWLDLLSMYPIKVPAHGSTSLLIFHEKDDILLYWGDTNIEELRLEYKGYTIVKVIPINKRKLYKLNK